MLEQKEKRRFSALHMVLAGVGGALLSLVAALLLLWTILGPQVLSLVEAWGVVQTQFVGEYDPASAADYALTGLVAGLGDRWSYYLDAESYAAQNQRRANTFVGVGVSVSVREEGLMIGRVFAGAPAEEAGLQPGELITAVDGTSLAGLTLEEGVALVQGEVGSSVTLTVRDEAGQTRQVTLRRGEVEQRSVEYTLLPDGVGYVRVVNFYSHSAGQVRQAVEDLQAQGAAKLVFDMRNNGGGYVSELTEMLDDLLPEGPIFRSESKGHREWVTQSDPECVDLPMATLVNANSYSAAEFFAAQLQESVGAPIVGEETSGKGYSQIAIPLPNGGALNLSTQRYRTGAGVSLIGTGVTLDREAALTEEQSAALAAGTLAPEEDPQLQAALELLN